MSSGASKTSASPPPYLDLAVMGEVRENVLSSRAVILFSDNLSNTLWVNSEGANLLGTEDVRSAIEGNEYHSSAVFRQISNAAGRLDNTEIAHAALRMTSGIHSALVPFTLKRVKLPNGTKAILLTSDPVSKSPLNLENRARSLVNSLESYGHATAVLGNDSQIIFASPAFYDFGLTKDDLEQICTEVKENDDRLVKRFINTKKGTSPAGIAHLDDEPDLHLLVVAESSQTKIAQDDEPDHELENTSKPVSVRRVIETVEAIDLGFEEELNEEPQQEEVEIEDTPEVETSQNEIESSQSNEPDNEVDEQQNDSDPVLDDAQPVRFTWILDKDLRFDFVSEELAGAVGPGMADIEEQSWAQVSARFGFENGDIIQALLEKGDTWSNRTVSWPVEGTDLRVPVDLSALPMSGRDREFDGFNGFGIVRLADAIVGEPLPMSGNLSDDERSVFNEIGARLSGADKPEKHAIVETPTGANETDIQSAQGAPEAEALEPTETTSEIAEPAGIETARIEKFELITVPSHDVDTSILARLPIPVLVYRNTELLFANQDFSNLTGYSNLHELAAAGGVEELFGTPEKRQDGENSAPIFHARGHRLNVRAHIQKVPWDKEPAMLLTLRRNGGDDGDRAPQIAPQNTQKNTQATAGSDDSNPKRKTSPFTVIEGGGTDAPQSFGGLNADDLRGILDTASDGVLILTLKGEVLAANQSAEALFDRSSAVMQGATLTDLLAPESRHSAEDYLAGLAQPGLAQLLNDGREMMLRTPRGGLVPVFMTIGPLGKEKNRLCAVMRDITPWKRSEEELVRAKAKAENASEHKSDFLARISHEIRTPLNAIIGFSDLMISERFGEIENDRYRGYLRDIHTSGRHVLDLINDLLDISKIEAGKMELTLDSCDLNALVSNTVALMQADANKERVIIRTSLSAAVPKVVADQRSLKQIILNLVSNAIKYTRTGGQVIVSTVLEERGDVVLRVRDTGIGMSARDLEQAMQPFQQVTTVPPVDQKIASGTGLGLPLTRALAEANKALFYIESEPEEGTMVEIRFQPERVLKPV